MSMSDLSSTTKCDQIHINDNNKFGHSQSCSLAVDFIQQTRGGFVEHVGVEEHNKV
jgi:hypothetical protein